MDFFHTDLYLDGIVWLVLHDIIDALNLLFDRFIGSISIALCHKLALSVDDPINKLLLHLVIFIERVTEPLDIVIGVEQLGQQLSDRGESGGRILGKTKVIGLNLHEGFELCLRSSIHVNEVGACAGIL